MTIMTHSANDSTTSANIGSVTATLLEQVPADLAAALRDAIGDDMIAMYEVGLRMGGQTVWTALENEGFSLKPKPAAVPATPKRHLMLVTGGGVR